MAIKRGDLVDAAKDLNKVLDLDPAIDVSKSVEEIRRDLEEASRLLSEDDALEDNTRAVVAALRGKEEVEKADAPAEKKAKGGGRPKGSKNKEKGAAAAAAPKKAAGAPRARSAAGELRIGEFKPVRSGTSLHGIIEGASSGLPVSGIADKLHLREDQIRHRLRHVLAPKHGIGFAEDASGSVSLVFPKGKGIADAVLPPS